MKTIKWISVVGATFSLGFMTASALQEDMAPVQAGEQHKPLEADCGSWDATMTMFTGGDETASSGVETNVMACDGLWQLSEFKGEFEGSPFEGYGFMGFDPQKEKYVGAWIDSWTPNLTLMEGTASEDGKVLTMQYEGPNMAGEIVTHIHVRTIKDDNHRVLEMYEMAKDGTSTKTMAIDYKRKEEGEK